MDARTTDEGAAPLGILAGGGALPREIVAACRNAGREVFIIGFKGQTDAETLNLGPSSVSRLGAAGSIIKQLQARGVRDLVMAGHIRRPGMLELAPDWTTARFMARLGTRRAGDDSLLSAIAETLERDYGFRLLSVRDLLPDILAPHGLIAGTQPDPAAMTDIARGIEVARALGAVDVGQSVVVQGGIVLGVEAVEGTDALIARCGPLGRDGPGGVLVKLAKPGQDERADLPTIGPDTLKQAADAGLRGVAVEAGRSLLVDRDGIVSAAEQAGLFVIAVDPDEML